MRGANLSNTQLEGANLERSDLRQADLSGARLRWANLSKANLGRANLNHIDLRGAWLGSANLRGASLIRADLSETELSAADLRGADLGLANLSGAVMEGTDFTKTKIGDTLFSNNDLSTALGLATVEHSDPSTIGIDTIYASRGKIPREFLLGAGVPGSLITYLRSLKDKDFVSNSCFISYSSKDQQFAEQIRSDLLRKEVPCWLATEDLKIGAKTRPTIDESIRKHDKLLLILSKRSIMSPWVEQEVETALSMEREKNRLVLCPIRLDNSVMDITSGWPALIKNTRQIGDFRKWKDRNEYRKALNRLIRDLKTPES